MGNPEETQSFDPPRSADETAQTANTAFPQTIGPFRLIERLGEGGMGTVYKANQLHPVKRTVAIKVIKAGFDSAEVSARFESERQALARMDHPNIAKVLDAGTDERGRPYFVMEYVPGTPITRYADDNRLAIKQRLELFLQVCEAIGHAHAKAIIHRDIKASNVLAHTTPDGPRIKVIDFGVAKALTSDRLTDRTFNTARGQAIGTYESMSPEQADGSPDIDTRTDVYSLGVLLYELLSGTKPFDKSSFAKAADAEIRRIIREEEPPRPSTQLSSMGGEATKIAKARQAEVEALTRQLKSELDWIPLMALRKERERRYDTPQQMAEDIQNYLDGRPLLAAPDSAGYRASKFVRRNRGPIAAGISVLAVLLLGITTTTIGLIGEARQKDAAQNAKFQATAALAEAKARRDDAEQQRTVADQRRADAEQQTAIAQAISDFQFDMLRSADPRNLMGDKVTVVQAMSTAARRLDAGQFADNPGIELKLRIAIGLTLQSLGHDKEAEPHLRRAAAICRTIHPTDDLSLAASLNNLAGLLKDENRLSEAESLYREALEIHRRVLPPGHQKIALSLANLAGVLKHERRLDEAESLYRESSAIYAKALSPDDPELANSFNSLALLLQERGKLVEAEALLSRALEIRRKVFGENHPDVAESLMNLAELFSIENKVREAEKMNREALSINRKVLPADHPVLALNLNNLATLLSREDKLPEAKTLCDEGLAIRRKVLAPDHPDLAESLLTLGNILRMQKRDDLGETAYREAVEIDRKAFALPSSALATVLRRLANLLHDENRRSEAEPLYREALDIDRKVLAPSDPTIGSILEDLANLLYEEHRLADAEPFFQEGLQFYRENASTNLDVAQACSNLACLLYDEKKLPEAETRFREVLEIRSSALGPKALKTKYTAASLARILDQTDRSDEATAIRVKHGLQTGD